MILAGDAIDKYITAALGITALFAAGIGNTISDAFGIFIGRAVEQAFERRYPQKKTDEEPSTRMILFAETLGIVLGCLIGLAPLLVI